MGHENMAMLGRSQGPLMGRLASQRICPQSSAGMAMKTMTPEEHKISRENFWSKNDRLQRPMSPHLTIYKMQMTSVLSITHDWLGSVGHHVRVCPFGCGLQPESRCYPGPGPGLGSGTNTHHCSKVRHSLALHIPSIQRIQTFFMGHGQRLPDDRFVQDWLDCCCPLSSFRCSPGTHVKTNHRTFLILQRVLSSASDIIYNRQPNYTDLFISQATPHS